MRREENERNNYKHNPLRMLGLGFGPAKPNRWAAIALTTALLLMLKLTFKSLDFPLCGESVNCPDSLGGSQFWNQKMQAPVESRRSVVNSVIFPRAIRKKLCWLHVQLSGTAHYTGY